MKTFIQELAELIKESPVPAFETCVVLPNRRSGLYLKKALIPQDGKPAWLPDMVSIEDLVFKASRLTEPDNTVLLACLYKAHQRVTGNSMSFDTFLSFGSEILRDFEEVDQYLADPADLFDYVKQAREIDIWKPGETLTEFEKNYLSFYNSLKGQYEGLKEELLSRKYAWQGLATRILSEQPAEYLDNLPWKQVIFAGFNALTPAQLKIIRHLVDLGKAKVLFDADEYYLNDTNAEAGYFLRKYQQDKSLGQFSKISSGILRKDRNIYTCGIPGKTGQARIVCNLLGNIPADKYHDTAVVLADESMLLPVLNSLPESLEKFNVTMGFPLSQAPLYTFADRIFRLQVNALSGDTANPSFYHQDVIAILQNTYLHTILDKDKCDTLISRIKKDNYSYISRQELNSLKGDTEDVVLDLIFCSVEQPTDLLKSTGRLISMLRENLSPDETQSHDRYFSEILFALYSKINNLVDSIEQEGIEIESLKTLHHYFRETVASSKIPFFGEPLEGIQIMGMLETRVLDFENIILISANEDVLPSARSNKSFIPFDIRVHYGLPTHHERQAVFAYHFYHLIQRCQNAWLIYNDEVNTLGGGEKSRYLSQLEWELPQKGVAVKKLSWEEPVIAPSIPEISVRKDPSIMDKLVEKAGKGFSFSSLKLYINCPLSFYYSYVLGLGEPEEVEEEISSRTMGSVIHEILEDLYKPFINKTPDVIALKTALKDAGDLVVAYTKKTYPALKIDSGKNLLFIKVGEVWLKRFLRMEIKAVEEGKAPVIKGIELPLERSVSVNLDDSSKLDVKLYGKIDRIDVKDGMLRVIDYKTGTIGDNDVKIKDNATLFQAGQKTDKQLQLSLYKFLAENNELSGGYQIQPGILSFKCLNKGFMALEGAMESHDFEQGITEVLTEIFNKEINFTQTEPKLCIYCNFQQICQRN